MARQLSKNIGRLHFVGIGGIGMSGIAELMFSLGYEVSGSDQKDSANLQRLGSLGIKVHVGHDVMNVQEAKVVVRSTAIRGDNPEILAAIQAGIPVVHRSEMLSELMYLKNAVAVAGTHGKTTTTSMISHLLEFASLSPTVINGGIIHSYGSNAKLGKGDWMVVEADESDGSFTRLPLVAGVVTNIDPEHMDHYADFAAIGQAFAQFAHNVPFFGFLVLCTDHPEVQALREKISNRKIISYGMNPHADIRATDIRMEQKFQHFSVHCVQDDNLPQESFKAKIALPGHHNISNALAAVAVARSLGVSANTIAEGLASFTGVKRRFQIVGEVDQIQIVDDYAHHPTEIAAVIEAARQYQAGKVRVIYQPHRYTRMQALYDDFLAVFAQSDSLLVMPVYAAGEQPIEGMDSETMVEDVKRRGHQDVHAIPADVGAMVRFIDEQAEAGDIVLCLGAGSISGLAHAVPEALKLVRCTES